MQPEIPAPSAMPIRKDVEAELLLMSAAGMRVQITVSVTGRRRYALISDSAGFAAPVHAIVIPRARIAVELAHSNLPKVTHVR